MNILIVNDMPVEEEVLAGLQRSGRFAIEIAIPPNDTEAHPYDADRLAEVDAIFCTFPPSNLGAAKKLRWIQIASTGYNQLFGLDLPARNICATNSRGCFDTPIAEWNVAMMVNLARDFRQLIRNQEHAVWDRSAAFQREIRGLTVGIWGYGGIGRETARLARSLGMRVHVLTRKGAGPRLDVYGVTGTGDPEGVLAHRSFQAGEELEFLKDLDYLVVAVPLTKATDGLIGERELQALPRRAHVLNPARGPIIREQALLRALREKWIAGAALDTHYHYPLPADHPLWHLPNVIMTPHISGSTLTQSYKQRLWDIFATNVDRFSRGAPLLNELTPAQLNGA